MVLKKNLLSHDIINKENIYAVNATALFKKYWTEAYQIMSSSKSSEVILKKNLLEKSNPSELDLVSTKKQDEGKLYDSDEGQEIEKLKNNRSLLENLTLGEEGEGGEVEEDEEEGEGEEGEGEEGEGEDEDEDDKYKEQHAENPDNRGSSLNPFSEGENRKTNAQEILDTHPKIREEVENEISQGNLGEEEDKEEDKDKNNEESAIGGEGKNQPPDLETENDLLKKITRQEPLGKSKKANEISELELSERMEESVTEKLTSELEEYETEREENMKKLKENRKALKKLEKDKLEKEKELELQKKVSQTLRKLKKRKEVRRGKEGEKGKEIEKRKKLREKVIEEENNRKREKDKERKRLEKLERELRSKEEELDNLSNKILENQERLERERNEEYRKLLEMKEKEMEEELRRKEKERKEKEKQLEASENKFTKLEKELETMTLVDLKKRLREESRRYRTLREQSDEFDEKISKQNDESIIRIYEVSKSELQKAIEESKKVQEIIIRNINLLENQDEEGGGGSGEKSISKKRKTEGEGEGEGEGQGRKREGLASPPPEKTPEQLRTEEQLRRFEEMMKEMVNQNSSLQKTVEELTKKINNDKESLEHSENVMDSIKKRKQIEIIDLVKEEIMEEEVVSGEGKGPGPVTVPVPESDPDPDAMPELVPLPPSVPQVDPQPQPQPQPQPPKRIVKKTRTEAPSFFSFYNYGSEKLEAYQTDIMLVIMSTYSELRNKYTDLKIPRNKKTVDISKIANIPELEGIEGYLSNDVSYISNKSENNIRIGEKPSNIETVIKELEKKVKTLENEKILNAQKLETLKKKTYRVVYKKEKEKVDSNPEKGWTDYFWNPVPTHVLSIEFFKEMISSKRENEMIKDFFSIDGEDYTLGIRNVKKDLETLSDLSSFELPELRETEKKLKSIKKFKEKLDAYNIPSNKNLFSPNTGIGFAEVYKVFFYNTSVERSVASIFRIPTLLLTSDFNDSLKKDYALLETRIGDRKSFDYYKLRFKLSNAFPRDKSPEDQLTNLFMRIDFPEVPGFPNTDGRSTRVNFMESLIIMQYQLFSSLFLPFSRKVEGVFNKALSLIVSLTISSNVGISYDYLQAEKVGSALDVDYGFLPNYEVNTERLVVMYFNEVKGLGFTDTDLKEMLRVYRSNIYALVEISSYISLQLRFLKKNLPKFETNYQLEIMDDGKRTSELIKIMTFGIMKSVSKEDKDIEEQTKDMGKTNYHTFNLLARLELFYTKSDKVSSIKSYFDNVHGRSYTDVLIDFLSFSNLSPFMDIPVANSILCTKLKRQQLMDEIQMKQDEARVEKNFSLSLE